jgi:hypothetical protein
VSLRRSAMDWFMTPLASWRTFFILGSERRQAQYHNVDSRRKPIRDL